MGDFNLWQSNFGSTLRLLLRVIIILFFPQFRTLTLDEDP